MKNTIRSAVVCSVLMLNGCSSTPENSSSDDNVNLSGNYYGSIVWDGDKYKLLSTLYTQRDTEYQIKSSNNEWRFDLLTLDPGFRTERWECQKSPSHNGCEQWEDQEDKFIHVSFTSSDYGDTPSEQAAKRLKEKKEAEDGITANDVVGVLLSPFAAVGAVAGFAAGAVIVAPIMAVAAAANPEDTFTRNNWVEFHHGDFNGAVVVAIENSKYESKDILLAQVASLDKLLVTLKTEKKKQIQQAEQLRLQKMTSLQKLYDSPIDVPKYEIKSFELSDSYQLPINAAQLYSDNASKIANFYANERNSMEGYYVDVEKDAVVQYMARQRAEFDNLGTEQSLVAFINKYQTNDMLSLVATAKVKLSKQRAQEEQQRIAREKVRREQQRKELEDLVAWRNSVEPGDDTFCGPIIEIKGPMVHIALNAKLPGYSSDSWLKKSELFPAYKGCINRNGNLSPQF
ncbi:hypothetical protein [Shewanella psychromarinicola]|uniref:Uncharacterized protein n=1 Tax=Shewanella psychromarinicola TaxID=2487742 RepID=A0A3N4D9N2_9GAMM|nr:hypothetical protein [Shewanella psychromarinicola]AZG33794.1 hypothetical protein EGC80_01875 [Shewanella psychromarinicola]MCL1084440.1 hypothetical protein [Shewanella psychromarinicola]RPA22419.1 hypothetical protein EGC77_22210 [Shewanella psychromarinicola]